jgi:hypothetical protein
MDKKFFVVHHLGLGDHLVMNGFVHMLLQQNPKEILLVCKAHNVKSVEKMYNGYPTVKLYSIKDLADLYPTENPLQKITDILAKGYEYIGFGVHGNNRNYLELDKSWANCFYKQYGLDPTMRWKLFKFPVNMDRSVELASSIIHKIGANYIVVHDDPSRGFVLDYSKIKKYLVDNGSDKMPVVYLGKDRYKSPLIEGCDNPNVQDEIQTETLYDYSHLLVNAKECHMMDSSIALLTDLLPLRKDQKRYMHEYAKVGEILTTEGLFQNEWNIIV